MSNKNNHGTHQEVHIGEFAVDRLGMLRGSAQRHRYETHDAIDWTYMQKAAAPPLGPLCTEITRAYDPRKSMAIYTYSYEGAVPNYEFSDEETTFELEVTFETEAIETHPKFSMLKKKYGWNPVKRSFAEIAPVAVGSRPLSAPGQKVATKSPLYGTDSWYVVGALFSKTYSRHKIPSHVLKGIGTIVAKPPGTTKFPLPAGAKKRNWLKLTPRISVRGDLVQITERWQMSGPRGWVKDVYSAGQLDEESPDSAGLGAVPTLSTSSL